MSRRAALVAVVVGSVVGGLAGCSGGTTGSSPGPGSPNPRASALPGAVEAPVPVLEAMAGSVSVIRLGGSAEATAPAAAPMPLAAGDVVRTDPAGRARLAFAGGSSVLVGGSTTLGYDGTSGQATGGAADSGGEAPSGEAVAPGGVPPNPGPALRFHLDTGTVWITITSGTLTVTTPVGGASVSGSRMVVDVAGGGATTVGCEDGHCAAFNPAGSLTIDPGNVGTIANQLAHPELLTYVEIIPCDHSSPDCLPFLPPPSPEPTAPPRPTATPKPTGTPLPTPFVLPSASAGPTDKPLPTPAALPTPDPSATPGVDGLTPEERANAGSHPYDFACKAVNRCSCNREAVGASFEIRFGRGTVTLAAGGHEITYDRTAPSTYTWRQATTVATITFSLAGWTFDTHKGGQACVVQTFRLKAP